MKKTLLLGSALILLVLILLASKSAYALCNTGGNFDSRSGPKLGNHTDYYNIVRQKYDAANTPCPGDPVSVTILFDIGAASDLNSQVPGILKYMHDNNLIPVIRLYTATVAGGFERWDTNDAGKMQITRDAARNLGTAIKNAGFGQGDVIVYLGNEINNPDEWPYPDSTINPVSITARITDFAKFYNVFADAASSYYKLYLPPLNAYLGSCPIASDYNNWVNLLYSKTHRKDGAALTIYNANNEAINNDYTAMVASYILAGTLPGYTISEVGPRVNCALLDGTSALFPKDPATGLGPWEQKMTDVYRAVKANTILKGAKHINTSFFLNCSKEDPSRGLESYLVVIDSDGVTRVDTLGADVPQCVGSGGGGGTACVPPAPNQPPNFLDDFFAGLISSLFAPLNNILAGLKATCIPADLAFLNADFSSADYNRHYPGIPICGLDEPVKFVSTPLGASVPHNYSTLDFPFNADLTLDIKAETSGEIGGYSSRYGRQINGSGVDPRQTAPTYLGGSFGTDVPDYMCRALAYRNEPKEINKDGSFLRTALNEAGAIDKMMPAGRKCLSDTGEYKDCKSAWRDKVLAEVMREWICTFIGHNCDSKQRALDIPSGWVTGIADKAGVASISCGLDKPGGDSYPWMASMFVCRNRSFKPLDVETADINNVCDNYLGMAADGSINPSGLYARHPQWGKFIKSMPSPDELAQYSVAWWQLPTATFTDISIKTELCTTNSENDPTGPPGYENCINDKAMSQPGGINAAAKYADRYIKFVSTPVINKLRDATDQQPPTEICPQISTDYFVADAVAGADISGSHQGLKIYQNPPGGVLGTTTAQGQVLAATDPTPVPSPYKFTHTFKRQGVFRKSIPQQTVALWKSTLGTQSILSSRSTLYTAKQLQQEVTPGTPFSWLPAVAEQAFNGDFKSTAQAAELGHGAFCMGVLCPGTPKRADAILTQAIYPPKRTGFQVTRWLHDLASRVYVKDLGSQVWSNLASFSKKDTAEK